MRTAIAPPEFGERPDAGLATLALQGLFAARNKDWHNLPDNVDLSMYDQSRGIFTPMRKADLLFDAVAEIVYAHPGPNQQNHIVIYGWQAVHFA